MENIDFSLFHFEAKFSVNETIFLTDNNCKIWFTRKYSCKNQQLKMWLSTVFGFFIMNKVTQKYIHKTINTWKGKMASQDLKRDKNFWEWQLLEYIKNKVVLWEWSVSSIILFLDIFCLNEPVLWSGYLLKYKWKVDIPYVWSDSVESSTRIGIFCSCFWNLKLLIFLCLFSNYPGGLKS